MDIQERNKQDIEAKAEAILHQVSLRSFDWLTVNTIKVSFDINASKETIDMFKDAFSDASKGTNAENANLLISRSGGGMPSSEDIFLDEVVCC